MFLLLVSVMYYMINVVLVYVISMIFSMWLICLLLGSIFFMNMNSDNVMIYIMFIMLLMNSSVISN